MRHHGDNMDEDTKTSTGLAIFELIQSFQCGPLAGSNPDTSSVAVAI
jgi:hypothetical protein